MTRGHKHLLPYSRLQVIWIDVLGCTMPVHEAPDKCRKLIRQEEQIDCHEDVCVGESPGDQVVCVVATENREEVVAGGDQRHLDFSEEGGGLKC